MGMTAEQAAAQIRVQAASRSGGGSRTASTSSGGITQDYEGLFQAARDSVDGRSFIANNYRRFGFTSSTGLWDAYQAWVVKQQDSGKTQLDFDPDEGIFTWNGERFNSLQKLLAVLWETDLTDGEKATLERKFALWGFDIAIP